MQRPPRTDFFDPRGPAKYIKTGLRVAGRASQEADLFKFIYTAGLRIEISVPGDPSNCIKTRLRFARRDNEKGGRFTFIYAICFHLKFAFQVILELWSKRVCALRAERIGKRRASNLYT